MSEKVLVTRFCRQDTDGTLRSGYDSTFKWPRSGPVKCDGWDPSSEGEIIFSMSCDDAWDPRPRCGKGLHGWLWGKGSTGAWEHLVSDVMLVVEVDQQDIVDLDGKVKFPSGNVVFAGTKEEVTRYMAERGHVGLVYGQMTVGDNETAEVGDGGTATAGYGGTAIAGLKGSAFAGSKGTAIAANEGVAVVAREGSATAGDWGQATAGVEGSATAGYKGTAKAGYKGTAKAGEKGRLEIEWYDSPTDRYRTAVGYVGENGIKPDTWYRVDGQGNFVEDAGVQLSLPD